MSEFPEPVIRYLEKHVRKKKDPDACYGWTGRTRMDRNGTLSPVIPGEGGGWGRRGARIAYELWTGPIPEGKRIVQNCGDTLCLNPRHLLALTYQEERRLRKAWLGDEVVLQVDIRADGTAYVYALTSEGTRRMRKTKGAQELENEEFLLPPGTVRFVGVKSHETIHGYVRQSRANLGDAGDGFYARDKITNRGWDKFREEEEAHLGIASDLDIG